MKHIIYWFTDSLIQWLFQCVVDSLVCWFTDSLIHWFIDSLTRSLFNDNSLIQWFMCSVGHSVSCACFFHVISWACQPPWMCSFVGTSQLQRFRVLHFYGPYNYFLQLTTGLFFVRYVRLGMGRALLYLVFVICPMCFSFFWHLMSCTRESMYTTIFLSYPIVSLYHHVVPQSSPRLCSPRRGGDPPAMASWFFRCGSAAAGGRRSEGGALEGSWKQLATWLGSAGNAGVRNSTMAIMGISWEITCKTHFYRKNSDGQISQVFRTKATQGQHTADPTFVGVSVQPHRVVSMTNGMPVRRSDIPMTRCDESISALLPLQRHCQILSAD